MSSVKDLLIIEKSGNYVTFGTKSSIVQIPVEKIKIKNMNEAVLVYPHQLFEDNTLLKKGRKVFLIEEPLLFTQYAFHKQKLVFHRASMQSYRELLLEKGYDVSYIEHHALSKTEDISMFLQKETVHKVYVYDVTDTWLEKKLRACLLKITIELEIVDTPMFLTDRQTLDDYYSALQKNGKKFFMKNFYEWQRKRLNILLDEYQKPVGGKWSFDEDNRQKAPSGLELPAYPLPSKNREVKEAKDYVQNYFSNNYGKVESFFYPVNHVESKKWLRDFLVHKLDTFGPYEDATVQENNILFHSVLSPLLNSGLLTPKYVVEETLAFAEKHSTPLASLEGFIRQIIGWREYIRAVYLYLGTQERTSNYFNATKDIPLSFWEGATGIDPLDHTIVTTLETGYAHHIPRLMMMGNFMNLCGFKPDHVYRWFMEMFIDAYDWVMVPNVYSMALYADGGLITTKPYISGSSYILKMSDFKKGPKGDTPAWDTIWDALFWNFVDTHFQKISEEGRLGFIGIMYRKMSEEKKAHHKEIATTYLASL